MAEKPILVALCTCVAEGGIEPQRVRHSLEEHCQGTPVHLLEDLCRDPGRLRKAPGLSRASAVVVGTGGHGAQASAFAGEARRAGLGPFSLVVVDLEGWRKAEPAPDLATARAAVRLAGAVARLRAHREVTPAAVRLRLLPLATELSRRSLFTLPPLRQQEVAVVNALHCDAERGCQLCVQGCPYQALAIEEDKVEVLRERCEGCGLCAALCPTGALDLPASGLGPVRAEIKALLTFPEEHLAQRAIVFTCPCTLPEREPLPVSYLPVSLPCAAMLTPDLVLLALALGAGTVVLPHGGACRFKAAEAVGERMDLILTLVGQLGLGAERARLLSPTGSPGWGKDLSWPSSLRPLRLREAPPEGSSFPALLLALARQAKVTVSLEHPASPLGLVRLHQGCTLCGACGEACPPRALKYEEGPHRTTLTFDAALCSACGACIPACPERVVKLRRALDTAALSQGRYILAEAETARCQACGRPFTPLALATRVAGLLEKEGLLGQQMACCPDCRILGRA